jgi:hypothetical protein
MGENSSRRSLLSSFSNASTKKEGLFLDCMATIESLLLCYALKVPPIGALFNSGTNKMLRNGTPSHPSGLIFNRALYPSRGRVFTSSTLNCDKVLDLLKYS